MKNYLILHYGFEKPTPDEMGAWNKWFESIADKKVDQGGFHQGGREISHSGTKDLPFGKDSITGYTVIKAENLDEAEVIAQECPIVASTRVYEINKQALANWTILKRFPPARSEPGCDGVENCSRKKFAPRIWKTIARMSLC